MVNDLLKNNNEKLRQAELELLKLQTLKETESRIQGEQERWENNKRNTLLWDEERIGFISR
jgi:hypothetical protein